MVYGTRTIGKNGADAKTSKGTDGKNRMGGTVGIPLGGLTSNVGKYAPYVTPVG